MCVLSTVLCPFVSATEQQYTVTSTIMEGDVDVRFGNLRKALQGTSMVALQSYVMCEVAKSLRTLLKTSLWVLWEFGNLRIHKRTKYFANFW